MAQRDLEAIEETSNSLLSNSRRCFCFPCFGSQSHSSAVGIAWWQHIGTAQTQPHNRWWLPAVTAFQKIREWSEIVAGPRWKTFIRRFNRNRSNNANNSHHHGKFQYDPLSYSLNFEEEGNFDDDDDDDGFKAFRNFSSRYASSNLTPTAATATDVRGQDMAVVA